MSNYVDNIISNMVEVELVNKGTDGFLTVMETLTRIGIPSIKEKKIYQSCHILHKQGKYFIAHFKEMYALDSKPSSLSAEDLGRRNFIVKVLEEWGLIKIVSEYSSKYPISSPSCVKIIKHSEKSTWKTEQKYAIGIQK